MKENGPDPKVPHSDLGGDQAERLQAEGYLGSESEIEGSSARENTGLWIAVLGSAVVWFVELQATYSLVPWACSTQRNWPLHVASAFFLVLGAVPGVIAWKEWRAHSTNETERMSTGEGRRRFMALLGLMVTG